MKNFIVPATLTSVAILLSACNVSVTHDHLRKHEGKLDLQTVPTPAASAPKTASVSLKSAPASRDTRTSAPVDPTKDKDAVPLNPPSAEERRTRTFNNVLDKDGSEASKRAEGEKQSAPENPLDKDAVATPVRTSAPIDPTKDKDAVPLDRPSEEERRTRTFNNVL